MTIDKPLSSSSEAHTHDRSDILALSALGWVLQEPDRAERLLSLTGLTPDDLRSGLANPEVQSAVLEHLANYEPDLIAAAVALGVEPAELTAAHRQLQA